jgi:hypothetical protein
MQIPRPIVYAEHSNVFVTEITTEFSDYDNGWVKKLVLSIRNTNPM